MGDSPISLGREGCPLLTHLLRIRRYRLFMAPSSLPTEHVFCLISFLSWLLSVYRSPSSSNPAETVFFMDRLLFPLEAASRLRAAPVQVAVPQTARDRAPRIQLLRQVSARSPYKLCVSHFLCVGILPCRTGRGQNHFTLAESPVSAGAEPRESALLTPRGAGILGGPCSSL